MNDQTSTHMLSQLIVVHAPYLHSVRLQMALARFGSADGICKATRNDLLAIQFTEEQIKAIHHPNHATIESTMRWLENNHHHLIFWDDCLYPPALSHIASAPIALFVAGDPHLLSQPQIAIVGSRNPSFTGLELAAQFASELSEAGLIITSGMAIGIDTASHQGAMKSNGKTIAVLGSGLQKIYPKKNQTLSEKIIDNGCLLSEFPLNTDPCQLHFPRRNRIISGLSLGTLVVEAALKSGSLITAHYALEQNRDVFAIPGSPRNPLSAGCLSLIQQGAKCVTDVQDILSELKCTFNVKLTKKSFQHKLALDCHDNPVLACIDDEVTTIDQICTRSKLSAQSVAATLLQLEMDGVVKRLFGGFIRVGKYR